MVASPSRVIKVLREKQDKPLFLALVFTRRTCHRPRSKKYFRHVSAGEDPSATPRIPPLGLAHPLLRLQNHKAFTDEKRRRQSRLLRLRLPAWDACGRPGTRLRKPGATGTLPSSSPANHGFHTGEHLALVKDDALRGIVPRR